MREKRSYGARREWKAPEGYGIGVAEPVAGFYRFRLRADGIRCGIHIFFGPPGDPVTGEILDRSPRWQCFVNGRYFDDFSRVWPACTKEPITEADYRRYCARLQWAEQHAPASAYADPRRFHDRLTAPLEF